MSEHTESPGMQLLIRLDTSSESFYKNNQTLRSPINRSACLQTVSSSPPSPVYCMEARFKEFCNRCDAAGLEQNICFCIPSFQLDRSVDKQGFSGNSRSNDTSDTPMADGNLVYSLTNNVHITSICFHQPYRTYY